MQDIIDELKKTMKSSRVAVKKIYVDSNLSDDELYGFMSNALCSLQMGFHDIKVNKFDAGRCGLSQALVAIGRDFYNAAGLAEDVSLKALRNKAIFGGIVVDCLINLGYIVKERGDNPRDAHEIVALNKWNDLGVIIVKGLTETGRSISYDIPEAITNFKNPHNRRKVLKTGTRDIFNEIKDTNHIKGLNVMQQTQWRINKKVLDRVLAHKWPAPPRVEDVPEEGNKKLVDDLFKNMKKDPSLQAEYESESRKWELKKDILKERSVAAERAMIISKSVHEAKVDAFSVLCELDYRGRAYYAEPYLHYQGADLAKGLLEFAKGVDITPAGEFNMYVYTANCYNQDFSIEELKTMTWLSYDYLTLLESRGLESISLDKMTRQDRYQWTVNNLNNLIMNIDTVEDALVADEPTVFLGLCLEIQAYLKAQAVGEAYSSHKVISIDGSQNVAQHAAAINLDAETASKVGVTPTEVPLDLYVEVGQRMMEKDPEFFETRGMTIKDVRKNISKRATMTRQYSAGAAAIAENMYKDCYKTGASSKFNINTQDCSKLSRSAVKSIDEVLPSNGSLRKYLQSLIKHEIGEYEYTYPDGSDASKFWNNIMRSKRANDKEAKILASITATPIKGNCAKHISWTTPSGFRAFTELNCYTAIRAKVKIQGVEVAIRLLYRSDIPNYISHYSAIAANMIHSFDSSHAMNTANTWGKDIALVHDSFGTHASNVDDMLYVIKDEFFKMYDELGNFYDYITDQILSNQEGFDVEQPERGDLDLTQVYDSDYFFC